jgi:hypothetical protein
MPNDAKIGLICGIGIVVAVALTFFRSDGAATPASDATAAVGASKMARASTPPNLNRSAKAKQAPSESRVPVTVMPAGRTTRMDDGKQGAGTENKGSDPPVQSGTGARKGANAEAPAGNDDEPD